MTKCFPLWIVPRDNPFAKRFQVKMQISVVSLTVSLVVPDWTFPTFYEHCEGKNTVWLKDCNFKSDIYTVYNALCCWMLFFVPLVALLLCRYFFNLKPWFLMILLFLDVSFSNILLTKE